MLVDLHDVIFTIEKCKITKKRGGGGGGLLNVRKRVVVVQKALKMCKTILEQPLATHTFYRTFPFES